MYFLQRNTYLFEAHFVLVAQSCLLVWPHGPALWLSKLEDHCHAMIHVVVNMAVEDPVARVVQWGPDNDISVGGHQNNIFENRVSEVAREALISMRAALVHTDHFFPGDIQLGVRELALADHVVPPTMLMDWVSDTSISVDVYENDFEPLLTSWLLEDMATVLWLRWPLGLGLTATGLV